MKITKSKEWYYRAKIITWIIAWFCCIVPTAIVGAVKLPLVVTKQADETLTGSAIIVIACCAYPLLKGILKMLKSPSAWLIMWILTVVLYLIWLVPHETLGAVLSVFLTAAIGNSIGAILFWLSRQFDEKWKFCGQITVKE
jgi:hypothetical protein